MTLLWFDGFETYSGGTNLPDYRLAIANSDVFTLLENSGYNDIGAYGRRGSNGIQQRRVDYKMTYTMSSNHTSLIFGWSIYQSTNAIPSYNASYPFFCLYDGSTIQLRFHFVGSEIAVYQGDGTLLGTTSGFGMGYGITRYFEVKFTIDNAAGIINIRSNETSVLSLTSQDTQNSANAYINKFFTTMIYNNITPRLDDFYICDLTGSKNNDFLGDVRVDVVRPDGAGTYTDFSPSAGSNYENVDETYPDDDTTYNDSQDAAAGEQDSYAMESLDVLGTTIHGVKDQITVRKTDAGARSAKILTIQGGSDYLGDEIVLSDTYTTNTRIMEDNPDDAAAFVEADIAAGEVGVEVTA